ncbi:putative short-chain dehydrogenase/reductase [Daldinia sp. FL1419]|nr:putative short-chain dehydrogenase/reductase [Daldinia sp. FL1419]
MPIQKKTALITECSDGGIGVAMAKILREKDYYVFATLRSTCKAGTLRDPSDIEIVDGSLDMLVNNASRDSLMTLLDVDISKAEKHFDVNFWGVLAATQAFAPTVIKSRGIIMNYSSVVWNLAIARGGPFQMPSGSYYELIPPILQEVREGKKQPEITNVDVLARQLVGDILGSARGPVWRGAASTIRRWLSNCLPNWLLKIA